MTMTLVSTVTVGAGGAASIDFTSIPQTGTDLLILVSQARNDGSSGAFISQVNGASTPTSTNKRLYGTGSSVVSDGPTNPSNWSVPDWTSETTNTFGSVQIYIPNYTSAANKSITTDYVTENNGTGARQGIQAGLLSVASAITSLTLGGAYVQYSTASLYTIQKGSGGASVA